MTCEKCDCEEGSFTELSQLPVLLCCRCDREFQLYQQREFEKYKELGTAYHRIEGMKALLKGGIDCLDDYIEAVVLHTSICRQQAIFFHRWLIG